MHKDEDQGNTPNGEENVVEQAAPQAIVGHSTLCG